VTLPNKRIIFTDQVKLLKVLLVNHLLAGVNINGDCTKLEKDYDIDFDRNRVVDLATFAKSNRILLSGALRSLTDLLRIVCGFSMEKDVSCQRSDRWNSHPLSQEFRTYILNDIYATSMVAEHLHDRKDVAVSDFNASLLVPSRKIAIYTETGNTKVAEGVYLDQNLGFSPNFVEKPSKTRVVIVIRVTDIFLSSWIIPIALTPVPTLFDVVGDKMRTPIASFLQFEQSQNLLVPGTQLCANSWRSRFVSFNCFITVYYYYYY
jgi:hypothetical protein